MATRNRRPSGISRGLFVLASLLFFVSGGTGLIYQVIWFKRFGHVWGSSSLAFAAVGGSFLFGLGLGAYWIGRRADSVRSPLWWYGVCELLIGLWAILIPFEIAVLVRSSSGIYEFTADQPLLSYLVQFCLTLLIIGPPCVLMGGTLPLLIRQLTDREGSLDQATGWLYAVNTFGAAAGCYLAGFHLLPSLGIELANYLTVAVNISIGLVSLLVSNSLLMMTTRPRNVPSPETEAALVWSPRLVALCVAAGLSGCAALMLEMTWSRQLALVLGGSTYSYTATLFVVLMGIASGSLLFHLGLRRWASSAWLPMAVVGLLVASTLLGYTLLPRLALWVAPQEVRDARGDLLWNGLICAGASSLLEFIPAIGMGVLFPLFVHLTQASAARVGAAVGTIYAWNTAGSIIGATFTSILLFPRIGTSGTTALAVSMYVFTLLTMLPWERRADWIRLGASAAIGAAAIAILARPHDPRSTNLGYGLYGYSGEQWFDANQVIFFAEGASSNVIVTKLPPESISLRVNGKVDASNSGDMATQLGAAYLPRIFKPDAREVLVIGYGSGCTPGHSLRFPDTHITCCELEPAVYDASECFGPVNNRPHEMTLTWLRAENAALPEGERVSEAELAERARFKLVLGDGRTFIHATDKKFDLIISEPSNPWVAGCSNLFTKEFFQSARQRLADDGVLVQWLQAYNFSMDDYLLIVRTMSTEFPYFGVLSLAGGSDTLLLASDKPLLPEAAKLTELQKVVDQSPAMRADLDTWFGSSDVRWILLRCYLAGTDQLKQMLASDPSRAINTDVNLRLEFDAPLQVYRPPAPERLAMRALTEAAAPNRAAWVTSLASRMGLVGGTPEFFIALGDLMLSQAAKFEHAAIQRGAVYQGYVAQAIDWYNIAARLRPDHSGVKNGLRRVELMANDKGDRIATLQELVMLAPQDAELRAHLAGAYLANGDQKQAAQEYTEALRLRPELSYSARNYNWANNLAWIQATSPDDRLRNGPEALRWAKAAAGVQDVGWHVLDTLAAAQAEVGQFDEAIATTELLIQRSTEQPLIVERFKQRLTLYRQQRPYREAVQKGTS